MGYNWQKGNEKNNVIFTCANGVLYSLCHSAI